MKISYMKISNLYLWSLRRPPILAYGYSNFHVLNTVAVSLPWCVLSSQRLRNTVMGGMMLFQLPWVLSAPPTQTDIKFLNDICFKG